MEVSRQEISSLIKELGSNRKAAYHLGIPESTLRQKMSLEGDTIDLPQSVVKAKDLMSEVDSLRAKIASLQRSKPKYIAGKDEGTRIVAIGDTHDSPNMDKDRFKWIARYCVDKRPDRIVHIGDFACWDSVSTHEPIGSYAYSLRPSFKADLESCEEAMCIFYKEIGDDAIPMELCEGNHEERITRFENKSPETVGTLYSQFQEMAARYRWRTHPFGQWLFIDGVGFTHVPKNIMGKPFGGQNPENQIANAATHSIVFGHTHRIGYRKAPKVGINNSVEILNLGSAMPDGYVAKYAGTSTTGWSYGIFDLTIKSGHIVSHNHINMLQLERDYG